MFQLLQSSQVKPRWEDVALKSTDVKTLWRMWSQLSIRDGLLKRRFESADIDVLEFREGFLSVAHGGMVGGQLGRTKTAAIYNSVACKLADMVLRYGCLFQFETVRTFNLVHNTIEVQLLNAATRNVVYSSPRVERQGHDIDRSMNIMVFGVAENKDVRVWRCIVDRALHFVAGCAVDVKDMLRVGRLVEGKTRPIVVKLRTAWDQRLILAESRKLKDFEERIFFSADEPIEERRKKMLGRIKARAQSNGQVALVVDGVLSVDGKPVFSLNEGKLIQDGSH